MPAVDRWWEDPYWTERQWEQQPDPSPPTQPPYQPYYPPPGGRRPTAATASPVDHRWDGVAAGYKTELEDLALQWQMISGFAVGPINEDALRAMADAHVVTLRDMGQYIWNNFGWQQWLSSTPWVAFGMDQTAWNRQVGDYQDAIERYTGQRAEFKLANGQAGDSFSQMIWDAMKGGQSQTAFTERLLHDENIQNQYGWIKFGLSFDDFQQRKIDIRMALGSDVSNEQALLQLQYMHQSRGENRAVTAPAPRTQQEPVQVSEVTVR